MLRSDHRELSKFNLVGGCRGQTLRFSWSWSFYELVNHHFSRQAGRGHTESEEQSELPRTLHSAFTASLEVGLMNSLPPSPTRQSRGSAHSISMMGGTAAIISARMVTVTFLVSFLQFNLSGGGGEGDHTEPDLQENLIDSLLLEKADTVHV